MKLNSTFALLDVMHGRRQLEKKIASDKKAGRQTRIPVTVTGYITGQWGSDDGTSIEFEIDVKAVKVKAA